MANLADNGLGGLYTGTYASNILLEPMFRSDDIMRNYTVYPNVKFKHNILMANKLTDITAVNTGCETNTCAGAYLNDFDVTQKVLEVQNVSVKQEQCWAEFKAEVLRESYAAGVNMPDLNGTQLADVIGRRVSQGIQHDTVRNMWAGVSALNAAATANCSYGSMGDGLWIKMSAANGWGTTGLPEVTATSSAAGAVTTIGATIAPSDAELLLISTFDSAPSELQQTPASEKKMFVTPNIYNAFYGSLTAVASAGAVDYGHSEAQTGVNYRRVHFRGVELVPMYEWDTAFTALAGANHPALFTSAAAADSTQGCIYAAKSNLFIGSDVTSPDTEFKMFYDQADDKMLIRAYFTMGFQFGWDSLVYGGQLV